MQKKSVKVSKNRGFECQLLPSSSVPDSSGWIKRWWRARRGKKERKKEWIFFSKYSPGVYHWFSNFSSLSAISKCNFYSWDKNTISHSFSYSHTRCLVQRRRNFSSHMLTVNSQARAFVSQNIRRTKRKSRNDSWFSPLMTSTTTLSNLLFLRNGS